MTMIRGNINSICRVPKYAAVMQEHVHRMRALGMMLHQTRRQALPVQWSHTIYDDRSTYTRETWEDYIGNEEWERSLNARGFWHQHEYFRSYFSKNKYFGHCRRLPFVFDNTSGVLTNRSTTMCALKPLFFVWHIAQSCKNAFKGEESFPMIVEGTRLLLLLITTTSTTSRIIYC